MNIRIPVSDVFGDQRRNDIAQQIATDLQATIPGEQIEHVRCADECHPWCRVRMLRQGVMVDVYCDSVDVALSWDGFQSWETPRGEMIPWKYCAIERRFELAAPDSPKVLASRTQVAAVVAEVCWLVAFRAHLCEVFRDSDDRCEFGTRGFARVTKLLKWAQARNRGYDWPC